MDNRNQLSIDHFFNDEINERHDPLDSTIGPLSNLDFYNLNDNYLFRVDMDPAAYSYQLPAPLKQSMDNRQQIILTQENTENNELNIADFFDDEIKIDPPEPLKQSMTSVATQQIQNIPILPLTIPYSIRSDNHLLDLTTLHMEDKFHITGSKDTTKSAFLKRLCVFKTTLMFCEQQDQYNTIINLFTGEFQVNNQTIVWVRTNKKGVTYIGSGKEYLKTLGSGEIVTLETLAKHNYVHAKTLKEIPNSPDNQKKLAKFGNKKWFVMNEPYVRKKMENDTNQQSHASLKRKHEHEPEQSVYNQKYSPTLFTMPQKNNNAPEQIITRSLTHK